MITRFLEKALLNRIQNLATRNSCYTDFLDYIFFMSLRGRSFRCNRFHPKKEKIVFVFFF